MINNVIPTEIIDCMHQAGQDFYTDLDELDWPDAPPGRDSPAREATFVFHIARRLSMMHQPFHLYHEAAVLANGKSERLDLVGFNGKLAIALEAKCFGEVNRNSQSLANQVTRMRAFSPLCAERSNHVVNKNWWTNAHRRLGIVAILSFSETAPDAWNPQNLMSRTVVQPPSFNTLLDDLHDAQRVCIPISNGKDWADCGPINFLLAGFEL